MITLRQVTSADRTLLWNLNQKYLYEMTNFYPDEVDAEGNYHYGHFEEYFTDPKRSAFFILEDECLAGFAMVNPYSYLGASPDHVMAEFCILPSYRRKHIGKKAANLLLSRYPGSWEIKFNEKNQPAKSLWTGIAAPFGPRIHHLNPEETVLSFTTDET